MRRPALAAALLASAGARMTYAALRARPPFGEGLWTRTNHRGETVTLLEGPAYVAGAAGALALVPGLSAAYRAAGLVALAGAGGFGAVDDLRESGDRKGLRGHLGELAQGRITTGGLKVLGIGATGLIAAALTVAEGPFVHDHGRRGGRDQHLIRDHARMAPLAGAVLSGAVIAAAANLVNLLDLRPGRALKVVLLTGAPVALGSGSRSTAVLAGAAAGAAASLLPQDLAERAMLGDTGANAAGALLGLAAVHRLGPAGQAALLTLMAGLTLISERISFTAVIESTPVLREFDALGRRPPA